jgi:DNA-binding transcriptional MerR regulator
MTCVPEEPEYLTTAQAAKALNIGASTLRQWARTGIVQPTFSTPGGQHRWVLEDLRRQLKVRPTEDREP